MKTRKSLTIESKLLGLLIFSAVSMSVGAVITRVGMSNLNVEVKNMAEKDLNLIQNLIQMQENQLAQVVNFEQAFRLGINQTNGKFDQGSFNQAKDEFGDKENLVNVAIEKAQSLIGEQLNSAINETEKQNFQEIGHTLNDYQQNYILFSNKANELFRLLNTNEIAKAKLAANDLQVLQEKLKTENTSLLQQVVSFSQNSAQLAQKHTQTTVTLVSIIFLTSIIAILGLGYWMTRSIAISLGKAVKIAEQVSEGNLTTQVEITSNDEIGQLLEALKTMINNLNGLISKVQQSGISITSSTTQMAASRKQLEATLTEQIASTNEVTATAQEIANTSEELVKTMEQITELSQGTAQAASQGQTELGSMETTMRQLAEATTSIASKLGVMSEKAHNINSVVLTITKVADQTNLLSLNAAIEAEKAGEYGAGFAVVAREIRRLADQTAVATLEIEQMVKEMQSAVSTGVMEMDKFNKEVSSSVQDVGNISHKIAQVIEQVQRINPRFELVSKSMEEQSRSARHIREAMEQLSEGSEQTAYSLHDTHLVLEQLDDAAQGLQTEISAFKVKS
ncbi:methyl-accepting chemotaxis protein [Aphanothece sacrum]|uniref:Two-component sensor histidine kinase n=1 Tax=Aphanothece sacrum FPU1 TaxID=1920663 RepID=A0A401ICF4_APHSA|nr:methyl-accepting chemotaxis protein [Aphanothece sacrum]GBF78973.1 two-component sensor histidine kinase [Aphanothece sacrum FPU1]GBF86679.1 two-component sensor histidine kinase [Aphanothece sacrum FPU3]